VADLAAPELRLRHAALRQLGDPRAGRQPHAPPLAERAPSTEVERVPSLRGQPEAGPERREARGRDEERGLVALRELRNARAVAEAHGPFELVEYLEDRRLDLDPRERADRRLLQALDARRLGLIAGAVGGG